jgi:hypothetical protein
LLAEPISSTLKIFSIVPSKVTVKDDTPMEVVNAYTVGEYEWKLNFMIIVIYSKSWVLVLAFNGPQYR